MLFMATSAGGRHTIPTTSIHIELYGLLESATPGAPCRSSGTDHPSARARTHFAMWTIAPPMGERDVAKIPEQRGVAPFPRLNVFDRKIVNGDDCLATHVTPVQGTLLYKQESYSLAQCPHRRAIRHSEKVGFPSVRTVLHTTLLSNTYAMRLALVWKLESARIELASAVCKTAVLPLNEDPEPLERFELPIPRP